MAIGKKSKKSNPSSLGSLSHNVVESKKLVDAAHVALGDIAPNFTGGDKNRQPKAPPSLASVVPTIAELIVTFGAVVPMHSVDTMKENLATVQVLEPLRIAAQAFLKKVEDAQYHAGGEAWGSATAFYTVLRRVEGKDGQLAEGLKPLASFFAKRSKKRATSKTTPQPSTPPAAHATSVDAPVATPTTHA